MWCHCFNEFSNELFYKSNNLFIKWVIAHVICTCLNVCMLNLLRKHLYCISSPQEYLMKFFQKLNFHRVNNDRRLEILWGFVEVDKLVIHVTRSKYWLLFHNLQGQFYIQHVSIFTNFGTYGSFRLWDILRGFNVL